jgi:uncharacterized protein YceH (UPF0502 family)
MSDQIPQLSPLQARVLGTLVEKQRTVPDTYPLSLNTLMAGCNQKTSRNPVMEVAEAEILQAIDGLKELGLVSEVSGSRVVRFAHHIEKGLSIPTQASALLTVLLLRGPQTAGELRLNCERLHKFADISSVEAFLEELAERDAGTLVVEMPRLPGARENRWMHLLSGPIAMEVGGKSVATPALAQLQARVDVLESEVASLRSMLDELLGR